MSESPVAQREDIAVDSSTWKAWLSPPSIHREHSPLSPALKKEAISTLLEGGVIHVREAPKMSTYCVPEELWTEVQDIVQEAVMKTIPKKKKCKMAKWWSQEALQIPEKRREAKRKGERKDIPI